ncbi:MAG: DUF1707 domain-containing protein [Actinomycetota bacterium]|nr:DUF1707 domain-containing protein [Actinomycetota bacterium]
MDREHVTERLRQATGEGRLATEELEQRVQAALSARTYDELDVLVADLPGPRVALRRESRELRRLRPVLGAAIAVPVALLLTAAVVLAITGVLAVWVVWLAVGWWFFGHKRQRFYRARHGRSLHACGGWQRSSRVRPPASRGFRA